MSLASLKSFLILNQKEVKEYFKWVLIFNSTFYMALLTGRWLQRKSANTAASWGTPKFVSKIDLSCLSSIKTGNSGRHPTLPYIDQPYWKDFEKILENNRYRYKLNFDEFFTSYRSLAYQKFFHPQRELNDSAISDGQFRLDV